MNYKLIAEQLLSLTIIDNEQTKDNFINIIEQLFVDLESGHSCSKLSNLEKILNIQKNKILNLLNNSNITSVYQNKVPQTPISIVETDDDYLIYISKYLAYEINIVRKIEQLNNQYSVQNLPTFKASINTLKQLKQATSLPNTMQLEAIISSSMQQFKIITGGPGTGKTTTATLLLWLLYQLHGNNLKIRICAPTGKASSRIKESITASIIYLQKMNLDISCFNTLLAENNFTTIHKLLGNIHNNIYFKHNKHNPLDIDVLIIDESSMISLPLFSKLLAACDPNKIKHIVCLGDKNQLSSVEEGYVFASLLDKYTIHNGVQDLFSTTNNVVTELIESKRNQGDIAKLATSILNQDILHINTLLNNSLQLKIHNATLPNLQNNLFKNNSYLIQYLDFIQSIDTNNINLAKLFKLFMQQNILCLTNVGIFGTNNLNKYIEQHAKSYLYKNEIWYTGRPIIILENDYSLGLNNGDIGICIVKNEKTIILFENGQEFIPAILPKYNIAYAITIHKSQGSEYLHVNIILSNDKTAHNIQNLLSRELIYTAVTRAKDSLTIFSNTDVLEYALLQNTIRNTGISIV